MILPKIRDPRLVTIRRGGTLTDADHHLLALWAASCAEHVLDLFEAARRDDPRPRQAIEAARAWVRGEMTMMQARAAGVTRWGRPGTCAGRRVMPPTPPARRERWPTWPPTISVRPRTRSRPSALPRRTVRPRRQAAANAGGSATSFRTRFASSSSTTSGCGTTSAGRCSTAEGGATPAAGRAWGALTTPRGAIRR